MAARPSAIDTPWGASPIPATNTTLTAPPPGLGAGEHITRIRWEFGPLSPGNQPTIQPRINGDVANPDNNGLPVLARDVITNCATIAADAFVPENHCKTYALGGRYNPLPPAAVPTLDTAGLTLLSLFLALGGGLLVWRRLG